MGADKSLLVLQGERLIERVARSVSAVSDELIVVTHQPETYSGLEARFTNDCIRGAGALAGIHAGLRLASHEWSLVVACDLPFLNQELLTYLIGLVEDYDIILPRIGGYVEPLHALYHRRCLPAIEKHLREKRFKVTAFHNDVSVRIVEEAEIAHLDPRRLSFFNLNTPQDWQMAQRLLAGETGD